LGSGRAPVAPGTAGSAATVVFWWILTRWIVPYWQPWAAAVLALLAVAIGIPAATRIARETGLKDPQMVVIDEVAGQLITLIAAPVSWKTLLAGFILFRAFDTTKPPPVRQLERLPEGIGIVVDDIGAGIYAWIVMQILLHFGWLH
jgi:phosphatidylglycerophosphatase A